MNEKFFVLSNPFRKISINYCNLQFVTYKFHCFKFIQINKRHFFNWIIMALRFLNVHFKRIVQKFKMHETTRHYYGAACHHLSRQIVWIEFSPFICQISFEHNSIIFKCSFVISMRIWVNKSMNMTKVKYSNFLRFEIK